MISAAESVDLRAAAAHRAQAALCCSPILRLRMVTVCTSEAGIELAGRVSSFYQKQLAQETVRSIARGIHVINHIEVEPWSEFS